MVGHRFVFYVIMTCQKLFVNDRHLYIYVHIEYKRNKEKKTMDQVGQFSLRIMPSILPLMDQSLYLISIPVSWVGKWKEPGLVQRCSSKSLVVDFGFTIPQNLRIPGIDEVYDTIEENQPKFFSVLICTQEFHQVPLQEGSWDKTAFITPLGKYQYKTMPQGMRNAMHIICYIMLYFSPLWT